MSNANKIARYLTAIDSTPSYAINILVSKPMTVTTTFFFFHTRYTLLIFLHYDEGLSDGTDSFY